MQGSRTNGVRLFAEAVEVFVRLTPAERLAFARGRRRVHWIPLDAMDVFFMAQLIAVLYFIFNQIVL